LRFKVFQEKFQKKWKNNVRHAIFGGLLAQVIALIVEIAFKYMTTIVDSSIIVSVKLNFILGKRNYRFFVLFLFGVFSSMTVMMINLIVFGLKSAGSTVSIVVIIVICSVVFACIGIPIIGFLAFHLYLTITGNLHSICRQDNTVTIEKN